jgi:CheY-like chemotaxis protein
MLMRDAQPHRRHALSAWMVLGALTLCLVPVGAALAADAGAAAPAAPAVVPVPPPPAAPTAPGAAVVPVPPPPPTAAPPTAAPPTAVPPTAAPPIAAPPTAAPPIETTPGAVSVTPTAEQAAASGFGGAGLPVSVVPASQQQNWVMMVHYYRLARFDLAKAEAEKFLAGKPTPEAILALTESPSTGYDLIVKMVRIPDLADLAAQILTAADEGARLKRTDGNRINMNLMRLAEGPRSYFLAFKELEYSGEYTVPYALALMEDASKAALGRDIYRALVQIGKPVVLPLTRALATSNVKLREQIVMILGDIGYSYSTAALKALIEDPKQPDIIKAAATKAIQQYNDKEVMSTPAKMLYVDLAEKYLSGKVTVADPRRPTTDVFDWVPGKGLLYRPAPSAVVNDILAVRACYDALTIDPDALEAVSLWATSLMDMESKTAGKPARESDLFLPENMPPVEFFVEALGQQHLYRVLDRAMREQNSYITVRTCRALEKIANEDFLRLYEGPGNAGSPLVMCLTYPDQRVRYAAAFALVGIRPTKEFNGYKRVVPALVEALNLEARKSILLVEPESDNRNRLQARLKEGGWYVVTATNGNEALSLARSMLRIDAVMISSRTKDISHGQLITQLRGDYETALTPILVLSYPDDPIKASWLEAKIPYVKAVEPGAEPDALLPEIDALKKAAGSTTMDPDASRAASLRAAELLKEVARTSHVFAADHARVSLIEALTNRPDELVIAVADALAQIPDAEIELALAKVALDAGRTKPVRIAVLKALDRSARTFGNKLPDAQVTAIQAMADTGDDDLRVAVGEALGGLNLKASVASRLILKLGGVHAPAEAATTTVAPPPPPEETTPFVPVLPPSKPLEPTPAVPAIKAPPTTPPMTVTPPPTAPPGKGKGKGRGAPAGG